MRLREAIASVILVAVVLAADVPQMFVHLTDNTEVIQAIESDLTAARNFD
jgi:hypothetical protein